MTYQCVATSLAGFIQQLAVGYCARGYHFYVRGRIPPHKDPARVDAKLIERYGIALSYTTRSRRKQQGWASVQYLRYQTTFVLLATHGRHPFFAEEHHSFRDNRRAPITVFGYAISHRGGHCCVRIARPTYRRLRKHLVRRAVRESPAQLEAALWRLPYQPYAPIRSQLWCLWRAVNRQRQACGLPLLADNCLRLRRWSVRPFAAIPPPAPGASALE